jgi:hypothetical protein
VQERTAAPSPKPPPAAQKPPAGPGGGLALEEGDICSAILRFLDGSVIHGAISGLSLTGCNVRIAQKFAAPINSKLEVEFQMRGLPFLLAGTAAEVRNQLTVDIRFLPLSRRKTEELSEVLGELGQ